MEIFKDFDLGNLTSIRIGGRASFFSEPSSVEEVARLIKFSREKDMPLFVLGGGSNTIFGEVKGLVISLRRLRGMRVEERNGRVLVEVLAGTPLQEIVSFAVKNELEGIYRLMGFPASVGGAVAMNAGSFGSEMKDFIEEVSFLDWEGNLITKKREEIDFSYRSSPFPKEGVVVSCKLLLKRSEVSVKKEFEKIRIERKRSQPINLPTSGSTFKNPYPMFAGELLERVGMKGFRKGGVSFSEKHANFLVNLDRGKFEEVRSLIEEAKRRVFEKFGVKLEEEVRLIEDSGSDGWKVL